MGCSLFPFACEAAEGVRGAWGTITLGFWIAVAVLGILVALVTLDKVNRVFGRAGVITVLAMLASGAIFVAGRRSVRVAHDQRPTQLTGRDLTEEEGRAMQRSLKAAGFDPGPIDGRDGPLTRKALRQWQASRRPRQLATGVPTSSQLRELGVLH